MPYFYTWLRQNAKGKWKRPGYASATAGDLPVVSAFNNFTPESGPEGAAVTVSGTGFTGVTGLKFGGVTATYTVVTDTQITTTVPVGGLTGHLTIVAPSGPVTTPSTFTVTATPDPPPDPDPPPPGTYADRADLVTTARTATTRVAMATIQANVGPVDLDVMTTVTGDITLSTAGQILRDTIVNGRVLSRGAGQLIDNCIIRGGVTAPTSGTNGLIDCTTTSSSGLIVRNTLIEPQTPSLYWAAGIVGARWTCENVEVRHTTDGLWPRDVGQGVTVIPAFNCAIYYVWVHDLAKFWPDPFQSGTAGNGTHNDGIQFFGGSGFTARAFIIDSNLDASVGNTGGLNTNNGGSTIAGNTQGNAAIQLNSNSNGTVVMRLENLDFQHGYFGSGGLGFNGLDTDLAASSNLGTVHNCDFFAPQWFTDYPAGTSNRGRIISGPTLTWTSNTDSDHGTSASVVRT